MIIIIPGACGRIGKTVTQHLFEKGHTLILGDSNRTNLENIRKKIGHSTRVSFFIGDLTKQKNIKKFISSAMKKFGKIDVAVNCLYPKSKTLCEPNLGKRNLRKILE